MAGGGATGETKEWEKDATQEETAAHGELGTDGREPVWEEPQRIEQTTN